MITTDGWIVRSIGCTSSRFRTGHATFGPLCQSCRLTHPRYTHGFSKPIGGNELLPPWAIIHGIFHPSQHGPYCTCFELKPGRASPIYPHSPVHSAQLLVVTRDNIIERYRTLGVLYTPTPAPWSIPVHIVTKPLNYQSKRAYLIR